MMAKPKGRWIHFQQGRALAVGTALACLAWPVRTGAQTCPEPAASDFHKTTLLTSSTLDHPVHMAVAPDGRVFIGEMTTGNIQVYKPGQATPVLAGKVPTRFENEDGLSASIAKPAQAAQSLSGALRVDLPRNLASGLLRIKFL
jgi:glucose/arabinose dehydrogenase